MDQRDAPMYRISVRVSHDSCGEGYRFSVTVLARAVDELLDVHDELVLGILLVPDQVLAEGGGGLITLAGVLVIILVDFDHILAQGTVVDVVGELLHKLVVLVRVLGT